MLGDILSHDTIIMHLMSKDKKAAIEELVDTLDKSHKISEREPVLQAILDREAVMSTGVGDGVAIPHGKSDSANELVAALGVTESPLDFESIDDKPVRLIWLLVGPPGKTGPHLKALSRISRLMHDSRFRETIIAAETPEKILNYIRDEEIKYFE
ncbi:MAG: PTS sugar transporter subunit IIA [Deferribacteres bacterium]|nr:PTS sugar transporter subunit IIA [candidate division KSB1 bacterium]MCB9503017.1 PTS sugar transporter subunit IIA [Deferribacteres bacterium]